MEGSIARLPDILEIARHAVKLGFMVVFGTNGMLIDDRLAKELVDIGVMGVGISIDSLDPKKHNTFRGVPGAWEAAVAGIEASKRNGLQFQVHFSAQPMNYQELPAVVEWAHGLGARVLNVFFMVCTGRGEELTDITPAQYEEVLGYLVKSQDEYQGMLIRARCAPHFKRLAYEKDPNSPITKATGYMGGGCLAGTNYARVTPNGELTPCPYMPLSAGNVRENSFVELWEKSDIFNSFRYPPLKGDCGAGEYPAICGGGRARPYVDHGDWLDEDQWCLYTPKGGEKIKVAFNVEESSTVQWDDAASLRLSRIPYFLRAMVKKGVEKHARENGIEPVTIELMEELRKKRFGNDAPVFKF
jgi:radical SAM protein with 4Fe4S-binding SPASM domain